VQTGEAVKIKGAPKTIEVINPATLERVGAVPVMGPEEVGQAVRRARDAKRHWAALSIDKRAQVLLRFRQALVDAKDQIAEVIVSETGKPKAEAYAAEIGYVCDAIGYWAKNAGRFLADERLSPHLLKTKRVISTYAPKGVVGIIGPWNFPLTLTVGEALAALFAGNAVVIKPSEFTPLSALAGAALAADAGLPEGVLQVVTGYGETGEHLIDRVDMVHFTGSTATGRKVMRRASERLIPVSLELGGKDPMIVLEDADLERAANGCVWGGLFNSGQVCISVERVYVAEPVYDAFLEKVREKMSALRQGVGEEDVDIGAMIMPRQIETVEDHVRDAVAKGARVLTGGRRNPKLPGFFYEPTLLADVDHSMKVMTEETFGPVIPVMKVKDAEEAVTLANDSRYGLDASIWSKDVERARELARRIDSGAVCINDCLVNFQITEAPMGGVKESGLGRRHGPEGIRKFCDQKTIVEDRLGLKSELVWYPTTAFTRGLMRRMINLLFGSGLRRFFG